MIHNINLVYKVKKHKNSKRGSKSSSPYNSKSYRFVKQQNIFQNNSNINTAAGKYTKTLSEAVEIKRNISSSNFYDLDLASQVPSNTISKDGSSDLNSNINSNYDNTENDKPYNYRGDRILQTPPKCYTTSIRSLPDNNNCKDINRTKISTINKIIKKYKKPIFEQGDDIFMMNTVFGPPIELDLRYDLHTNFDINYSESKPNNRGNKQNTILFF